MTDKEQPIETSENLPEEVKSARQPRLTAAQEDEAAQLARELLLTGKAGISTALDALLSLSWSVGVGAIASAWPELKPAARKQLIAALDEHKSDAAKRLRLSIARGLLAIDAEAVEQITTDVCRDLRPEGGMAPRDRLTFGNVFVGKGKPWLAHLPIGEWKDATGLIACALDVCFGGPSSPLTQLSLLRWLAAAGRLNDLDEPTLASIANAVKRWNPRFQNELRGSVPELPAAIAESLAAAAERPQPEPREGQEEEDRGETDSALERMVASTRGERRNTSRDRQENASTHGFDLVQALRQIDSHVAGLRRELQEARAQLRQREGGRGRSSRREEPASDETDGESLRRHNAQLEETVSELRQRLEELASDHEDRAAATETHGTDQCEALKELLGLKLRESFAEFAALRSNAADEVVRQHFGDMLESIFRVLQEEGIKLQ